MSELLILGEIHAGFPWASEGFEDKALSLDELLIPRQEATYFMRVRGDHLRRWGVTDGGLLVVDRSLKPRPGTLVVYEKDGGYEVGPLPTGKQCVVWGVVTASINQYRGQA